MAGRATGQRLHCSTATTEPVEARPSIPIVLGGVTGKSEEVSQELRGAVEAQRAAVHALIGAGNVNDRKRVELENEVCRKRFRVQETPSITLADLRWKTIYLWPNDLRDEKIMLDDANSLDAIRDDLIRLAQRGSAAIEPHQSRPSEFDLSGCDLAKLGRLYETVTSIWRHVGAETQCPCFWDAKRENFNPAGRVLNAEADRLADLLSAIEREAKLRTPENDDARDERLNVLALHELLSNGRFHDRGLGGRCKGVGSLTMANIIPFHLRSRLTAARLAPMDQLAVRAEIEEAAQAALDTVDHLLAILDGMEPRPDDEDGGNVEPDLGAPECHESRVVWLRGTGRDLDQQPEATL